MRSLLAFLLGVYVGQEYGNLLPSLKNESIKMYENIKKNLQEKN